jgi:hypothetical protein
MIAIANIPVAVATKEQRRALYRFIGSRSANKALIGSMTVEEASTVLSVLVRSAKRLAQKNNSV